MRTLTWGLLTLTLVVATTAASCGDDTVRAASRLGRTGSDNALSAGITLSDDAIRVAPGLGTGIRSRIQSLSQDAEVQEAAYGLAWDVMCDVIADDLPESLNEIVSYVVANAASFGLEFTDEGSQLLGEAILDEMDGEESDVREACVSLKP